MSKKMFKYVLEVNDEVQEHEIPEMHRMQAEWHVGLNPADQSQLAIWFFVEADHAKKTRKFFVRGTGQSVPDSAIYMGSVHSGIFMWHVFEA